MRSAMTRFGMMLWAQGSSESEGVEGEFASLFQCSARSYHLSSPQVDRSVERSVVVSIDSKLMRDSMRLTTFATFQ
jgi:hypothetical protein